MPNRRDNRHLVTEKPNPKSLDLDTLSSTEIITLIMKEDRKVLDAIMRQKSNINRAVDLIVSRLSAGGRLFFIGAGTSGRLGVMEATECPPTFGTKPGLIRGIIAGGKKALSRSIEGAEDSRSESQRILSKMNLNESDAVVGIAASAKTPFVLGGLYHAKKRGAARIFVTCNPVDSSLADITIPLLVGPEILTGSTRMKAGTATKMVLNMLTTASMVRLGKTYGNLMVEVQPKSQKLRERAKRIVVQISGADSKKAETLLKKSDWNVKAAVVMAIREVSYKEAKELLAKKKGFLREALK